MSAPIQGWQEEETSEPMKEQDYQMWLFIVMWIIDAHTTILYSVVYI